MESFLRASSRLGTLHTILPSPHPVKRILVLSHLTDEEAEAYRRGSDLPKVTQLMSSGMCLSACTLHMHVLTGVLRVQITETGSWGA